MNRPWLPLTLFLLASTGQAAASGAERKAAVTVGTIPTVTALPGDSAMVDIPLTIAEGQHVMANPAGGEFLIPLGLRIEDPGEFTTWSARYPRPVPYRLEGTDENLPTYQGDITIRVVMVIPPDVPAGPRVVSGEIEYQACDARQCFFPTHVPVQFTIVVGKRR